MTTSDAPVRVDPDVEVVLERVARALGGAAVRDAPLGARTTYRVGGRAALCVELAEPHALEALVEALAGAPIPLLVLGNGSNLLVADTGFAGLVVHLAGDLAELELEPEDGAPRAVAGGGLAYPVLARRLAAAGAGGMGWAVGVPGTVGGAVAMNAGGHGSTTADHLEHATLVQLATGARRRVDPGALEMTYRHSNVAADELVLDATFVCVQRPVAELEAELAEIVAWRRAHQPGGRNGGSVFTNPPGDAAGRLVEEAGLRGYRLGAAAVSDKHANFVQADPDASAADVYRLIEEVRRLTAARTGVELALELRLVGFS